MFITNYLYKSSNFKKLFNLYYLFTVFEFIEILEFNKKKNCHTLQIFESLTYYIKKQIIIKKFFLITGFGWWFNTEDKVFKAIEPSNLSVGFEDSILLVEKTFRELGPFDGVIGFSQGASFVSILCAMQQKKSEKIFFFYSKFIFENFNDNPNYKSINKIKFLMFR